MTLPQLPGGSHLHRKHFPRHRTSTNSDARYIHSEANRLSESASARCRCERNRQLTAQVIELLQRRYKDNPPDWVHKVVDRLLIDQETLSAMTREAWD